MCNADFDDGTWRDVMFVTGFTIEYTMYFYVFMM